MALAPTSNPFLTGGLQDTDHKAGLQKFVPEVWGMAVQDYMEKALVFGKLCNDLSNMVAGGGDLIHLPQHDELVASDLYGSAAGRAGALQSDTDLGIKFDDTTTAGGEYQLLVNQSHYAAFSVSDLVRSQSSYELMNMYTQKLGYALAKKIDFYLANQLFDAIAFNKGNDNSATAGAQAGNTCALTAAGTYNIDISGVANVVKTIYEADSVLDDWTMVLVPATYSSLFKLTDFARYDAVGASFGNEVPIVTGYAGKLAGVDVIVSNNFVSYGVGASTSGAAAQTTAPQGNFTSDSVEDESETLVGYLVHKDAMHIAYAAGMKGRVQSEYDLTSLSTRFVADTVYGCTIVGSTTNKKVIALMDA